MYRRYCSYTYILCQESLLLVFQQPLSDPTMSGREAEGRLQVLQIYRLLQCVHEGDKAHIEKMVNLGAEDLINLSEPKDGIGVLHIAVSANSQGDSPLPFSVTLYTAD